MKGPKPCCTSTSTFLLTRACSASTPTAQPYTNQIISMNSAGGTESSSSPTSSIPSQSTDVSVYRPTFQSEAATSASATRDPKTANFTAGFPCRSVQCSFFPHGYEHCQKPEEPRVTFYGTPTDAILTISTDAKGVIRSDLTFAMIVGEAEEHRLLPMMDITGVQMISDDDLVSIGCLIGSVTVGYGWNREVQPFALFWPRDGGIKTGQGTVYNYAQGSRGG